MLLEFVCVIMARKRSFRAIQAKERENEIDPIVFIVVIGGAVVRQFIVRRFAGRNYVDALS